jgi:hypothetical protein
VLGIRKTQRGNELDMIGIGIVGIGFIGMKRR